MDLGILGIVSLILQMYQGKVIQLYQHLIIFIIIFLLQIINRLVPLIPMMVVRIIKRMIIFLFMVIRQSNQILVDMIIDILVMYMHILGSGFCIMQFVVPMIGLSIIVLC